MNKNLINKKGQEENMNEKFLRLHEVKRRTGLSRTTIYDWMSKGKFPRPIHLGVRSVAWREKKVNQWMQERIELSLKKNK